MKPLLEQLILFFKKIPEFINDREKIVNIVFSPLNFRADGSLRPNAYKCKRGKDDLSVNRLDFLTLHFCKRQGLKLEKNAQIKGKNFFGIALLFALEIRKYANIIHKPVKWNKAHAEIKTGHILQIGEVAPAEYTYITDELTRISRIYKDEDVNSNKWTTNNYDEIINLKLFNNN